MKSKDNRNSSAGFTFLELIVALTVASVVVLLAYRFLHDTTAGVRLQGRRTVQVEEMIICRKKIENAFSRIDFVTDVLSNRIICKTRDTDESTVIELKGDSLTENSICICKNIKNIKFESGSSDKNQNILYWECELKSGKYISGAKKIQIE